MTTCDMCSSTTGPFYTANIEGAKMRVCNKCKHYAKEAWLIKESLPPDKPAKTTPKAPPQRGEIIQVVVPDYGKRIRQARERLGLKQEVLAKQLSVKGSELHTWENHHRTPSHDSARKLEKALHITLIDHHEEKPLQKKEAKAGSGLTIGDMLRR
ncbi:TIGR00270 family protein [Candidatus Woesearchaeota archaeon]|nr:TIGR00270 family protein [Candidatus Woesearchaeota archaeon]